MQHMPSDSVRLPKLCFILSLLIGVDGSGACRHSCGQTSYRCRITSTLSDLLFHYACIVKLSPSLGGGGLIVWSFGGWRCLVCLLALYKWSRQAGEGLCTWRIREPMRLTIYSAPVQRKELCRPLGLRLRAESKPNRFFWLKHKCQVPI